MKAAALEPGLPRSGDILPVLGLTSGKFANGGGTEP